MALADAILRQAQEASKKNPNVWLTQDDPVIVDQLNSSGSLLFIVVSPTCVVLPKTVLWCSRIVLTLSRRTASNTSETEAIG
jgi:hypothetical protein